jgi:predicted ATPase
MAGMRDKLRTLVGGIEASVGPRLPGTDEVPPPFFGRGSELAVLRRLLGAFRSNGESRAITLIGPAGIGKTRLIEEFTREARQLDDPPVRIFRATAPRDGSSWSSFTQILSQRFEIAETNGLDEAKESVRTQVAGVLEDRKVGDVLYLLGDLLDLEFPKSPLTKAIEDGAPETDLLKRAILKSFIEADAAFGPMCLVFDDLQSAHDHTLGMLRFLIENLKAPVLFLCAARPEIFARHGALAETPSHTTLQLEPLGEVDSSALIGSVLTPEGMTPMHLVDKVRAITGGNPGRIEEAGRNFRERGTLPPPSIGPEAAVEARVEQLTKTERLLLQKAAVMGGVFWLGGLIVLDRDGREPPEVWNANEEPGLAELSDCLAHLTERDYILRLSDSTFPHDVEYVFRHRSEREKIAALTGAADARRWHHLLADWLDSQPETRSHEEYLELLADQREKAGSPESAAGAFLEAAGQARAHGSPKRELAFYEKALALIEDGHSRRLTALLRACELLEQLDRPQAALDRYREAATLAFRLNRRRQWESAHLAATRLHDKLQEIADAKQAELDAMIIAKRRAELAAQPAMSAPPLQPPPDPASASVAAVDEGELAAETTRSAEAAPEPMAVADDDRWDIEPEDAARVEESSALADGEVEEMHSVEIPVAVDEEPPLDASSEATITAALMAPADDVPADNQPTMLSAADIRTDLPSSPDGPLPIVVHEPPNTEGDDPSLAHASPESIPQPKPDEPAAEPEPVATGTETGT